MTDLMSKIAKILYVLKVNSSARVKNVLVSIVDAMDLMIVKIVQMKKIVRSHVLKISSSAEVENALTDGNSVMAI